MFTEGKAPEAEQDDVFSDDFETSWGDEEVNDEDESKEEEESSGESEEEESESEEEKDDEKKSDNSAIYQKKRYRDLYQQSQEKIAELEKKLEGGTQLSAEEQKEKAAEEFLSAKIRDVLGQIDAEKQSAERQKTEAFQSEMEEVLDENEALTEKQVLEVTEELGVSPKQAVKIIERERKLTKRAKPNLPKEKRAGTKAETKSDDKKEKAPSTLDAANRKIKAMLGRGEL